MSMVDRVNFVTASLHRIVDRLGDRKKNGFTAGNVRKEIQDDKVMLARLREVVEEPFPLKVSEGGAVKGKEVDPWNNLRPVLVSTEKELEAHLSRAEQPGLAEQPNVVEPKPAAKPTKKRGKRK